MNASWSKGAAATLLVGFLVSIFTQDYSSFLEPKLNEDITSWGSLTESVDVKGEGHEDEPASKSQQQQQHLPELFYQHHHEQLQTLINESTILSWKKKKKPTAFGAFFDYFKDDYNQPGTTRKFATGDICRSAKMLLHDSYKPRPHVLLLTPFDENWGALSTYIPNRTSQWWNLTKEWKRNKCSRKLIFKYLNRKTTLGVITVQHQDLDHPKVHSIPLGLTAPQIPSILSFIREPTPATNRSQLLMINAKPRAMRKLVLETVLGNFNGTANNTYGGSLQEYYQELRQSKFILSPGGLGLDCYRHWEALYLGTIPVLETLNRTDGWFRTLQHLPVAWIDHYANLTPQWLEDEYERILQKIESFQYAKLTKQYWVDLIRSFVPKKDYGVSKRAT